MKILEELWYGNVVPNERELPPDGRQREIVGYIDRHEKELLPLLSEQAKETYDKLRDCRFELSMLTERDAFVAGFELGMKIMMEVTEDKAILRANDAETQRYLSEMIGTGVFLQHSINHTIDSNSNLIGSSVQSSCAREARVQPHELSALIQVIAITPYGNYHFDKIRPDIDEFLSMIMPREGKTEATASKPIRSMDVRRKRKAKVPLRSIKGFGTPISPAKKKSNVRKKVVKKMSKSQITEAADKLAEQVMHDIRAMKYDEQSADKNKAVRRNYFVGELICRYLPALVETIPVREDNIPGTTVVFEDVLMLIAEDFELMEDLKAKASDMTGQELNEKRRATQAKSGQYSKHIRYIAGGLATEFFPELLSIEPGTKEENAERFSFFERFLAILSDEEHLVWELIREARMITCDDGNV